MCKDLADLLRRLSVLPGIDDLSLSTNSVLLVRYAYGMKDAGMCNASMSVWIPLEAVLKLFDLYGLC